MKIITATLALLLLLEASIRPAQATPAAAPVDVLVAFEGMIVHVLGGGVTRAIVPRLPGHQLTLTLPASAKTDVERIFAPLRCPTVCDVPIDGVAFRIVDLGGQMPARPFVASADFERIVTRLSTLPSEEKPFAAKEDLVPEIFAASPLPESIVAGFFELAGGVGTTEPFTCPARFEGTSEYLAFPSKVDVLYAMPQGAKLQARRAGSNSWDDIALSGPLVRIAVKNDIPDALMSHFDMLAALSMKRKGGGFINLPDIHTDGTNCIAAAAGVPGCSNSQWP